MWSTGIFHGFSRQGLRQYLRRQHLFTTLAWLAYLTDLQDIYFKRPADKLFGDAKRIYEMHVNDAINLLKERPYINDHILRLVLAHGRKQWWHWLSL